MEPFEEGIGPEETWLALNAEERETLRAWVRDQVFGIFSDGKAHGRAEIRKRLKQAMEADPKIMELFVKSAVERAIVTVALEKAFPSKEG